MSTDRRIARKNKKEDRKKTKMSKKDKDELSKHIIGDEEELANVDWIEVDKLATDTLKRVVYNKAIIGKLNKDLIDAGDDNISKVIGGIHSSLSEFEKECHTYTNTLVKIKADMATASLEDRIDLAMEAYEHINGLAMVGHESLRVISDFYSLSIRANNIAVTEEEHFLKEEMSNINKEK